MRIIVKAKAAAKTESIERLDQATLPFDNLSLEVPIYKITVKEPPVNGKSNEAIRKVLASYFKISLSAVTLVSGRASKQKIFEINK